MSEVLDRIRGEIRERLEVSRAAVQEYKLLEAALTALGGPTTTRERPSAPATKRAPAATSAPVAAKRAAATKRAPRPRAARGANREVVLRVLGERPGVSVSELTAASGVGRPVVYALLARLVDGGEVVKEALPGGSTGYSLRREGSAPPTTGADVSAEAPAATAPAGDDPAAA